MSATESIPAYFKIAGIARATETIRKSKFIAVCFPIASQSEVTTYIEQVHGEHRKATHICWAYRIFANGSLLYYQSDAGEPRGSAGAPILKALEYRELVDSLCIVTRYFGGVKLGIGGLVRAYGRIAGTALDLAGRVPYAARESWTLTCTHADYADCVRLLSRMQVDFDPQFMAVGIRLEVKLPVAKVPELQKQLQALPSVKIEHQ